MWTFIKWTHLLRTCNVDIYKVDTFSEDISVDTYKVDIFSEDISVDTIY